MSCRGALTNTLAQHAHWPTRRETIDGIANASRHRCSARVTAMPKSRRKSPKTEELSKADTHFQRVWHFCFARPPRRPRGYAENGVYGPHA
jgi:hypothetical protein